MITVATGAVGAPIAVGSGPVGVAITPDGTKAYVTNSGDSTVSVITVATGAVSAPITVGGGPQGVAVAPDGTQAFVTNFRDNTVSVITVATGAVGAPITVGSGPVEVAIAPDGTKAYVTNNANEGNSTVSVLNFSPALKNSPPVFTSTAPTNPTVGTAYSFTVTASGTGPIAFTVTAGALPNGITLTSASGVLAGTATAGGAYPVSITATGPGGSATASYILTVASAAPIASPVTGSDPAIHLPVVLG